MFYNIDNISVFDTLLDMSLIGSHLEDVSCITEPGSSDKGYMTGSNATEWRAHWKAAAIAAPYWNSKIPPIIKTHALQLDATEYKSKLPEL